MKMRPSRWIFSPLGQPSYCATRSHSPVEPTLKTLPKGMSTHHRLPSQSNAGPSRKLSTAAPWRLGSDHAVRFLLRYFAGSDVKRRTSIFRICSNGLNTGMRRRIRVLTRPYKEEFSMKRLALLALVLVSSLAIAQTPVRVRGTITALSGDVLSVKSRDGKDLQLQLAPDVGVSTAKKATLDELKGKYVGVPAMNKDGRLVAVEVHALPPQAKPGH